MRKIAGFGLIVFAAVLFGLSVAEAKMEFFKAEKANRPDLKCVTCHTSVPTKSDIAAGEKLLNEVGKFYQGHKTLSPRR